MNAPAQGELPPTPHNNPPRIAVADLRVGHYVHLDLGWMDHPFARSSFKITSLRQIETIRSLGLTEVRYAPERSDPVVTAPADHPQAAADAAGTPATEASVAPAPSAASDTHHQSVLDAQRQALQQCERRCAESSRAVKAVLDQFQTAPEQAGQACARLIQGMVTQIPSQEDAVLRLLAEGHGDRATLHAMNVTVLSLLLGRAMGMAAEELEALGVAAVLHDVGKVELPDRVRFRDDSFTSAHFKLYQEHVMHSVAWGRRMGLSTAALLAIAQHHEAADGSGFPKGLHEAQLSPAARILALINRYDGLCNPPNPLKALTPHEALSLIFATMKPRFEQQTLNAFIRMMGVYPPGSVVQLTDERYALVISVNSSRPLKPRVMVYDTTVACEDALLLDLQQHEDLGIQRSLRIEQLPRAALTYLSPRQRICYYFERAAQATEVSETMA
ncbi:HD-GYP domain-containing protein [Tepidicella baoligensis]|uniref:HD-GYP domain-containing protein n=1 Tax=Tepidicella baoligensis TaxID=2707016 RepID=UPI0015D9EBA4|nr:HD-GYP domain-containing protein [Tepidicella baoligensis]